MPTLAQRQEDQFQAVKRFAEHREKVVRFELPKGLERKEHILQDLAVLKRQNWKKLEGKKSELWAERKGQNQPAWKKVLTADEFWKTLYSTDWDDCGCLRLCEGELLKSVLIYINRLLENNNLFLYKTAKFDSVTFSKKLSNLAPLVEEKKREVPIKIVFTYYSLTSSRKCSEDAFDILSLDSNRPSESDSYSESTVISQPQVDDSFSSGDNSSAVGSLKTSSEALSKGSVGSLKSSSEAIFKGSVGSLKLSSEAIFKGSSGSSSTSSDTITQLAGSATKAQLAGTHSGTHKASSARRDHISWQDESIPAATHITTERRPASTQAWILTDIAHSLRLPLADSVHHTVAYDITNPQTTASNKNVVEYDKPSSTPFLKGTILWSQIEEARNKEHASWHQTRPRLTDRREHIIIDAAEIEEEQQASPKEPLSAMDFDNIADMLRKRKQLKHLKTPKRKDKKVTIAEGTLVPSIGNNPKYTVYGRYSKMEEQTKMPEIRNNGFVQSESKKELQMKTKPNNGLVEPSESDDHLPELLREMERRRNFRPFRPLKTHGLKLSASLDRMKKQERLRRVMSTIPEPTPAREMLCYHLQNFLEMRYLPRLEQLTANKRIVQRHRLRPRAYARREPPGLVTVLPEGYEEEPVENVFFQNAMEVAEWMEWIHRAVQDFVVRKEQVTYAEGTGTVTCITFNKKQNIVPGQKLRHQQDDYNMTMINIKSE